MATSRPTEGRVPLSARAQAIVRWLVVLTVAAIVIAVSMAIFHVERDTLWYEIGALVAQAGILTGFGAIVALLVHEYQQDQAESRQRSDERRLRSAARNQWLRDFATQVTDAYSAVKQARRRLQWDLSSGGLSLPVETYEKQIGELSAVQTRFETLQIMAETALLDSTMAARSLKRIEDNLSNVISERKEEPVTFIGELPLVERGMLAAFIAEIRGPKLRRRERIRKYPSRL